MAGWDGCDLIAGVGCPEAAARSKTFKSFRSRVTWLLVSPRLLRSRRLRRRLEELEELRRRRRLPAVEDLRSRSTPRAGGSLSAGLPRRKERTPADGIGHAPAGLLVRPLAWSWTFWVRFAESGLCRACQGSSSISGTSGIAPGM